MTPEEALVRWTVRVALLLYALALFLRLGHRLRIARLAWTAGFLAMVLHVAAAFHVVHGWSHADAYAETARKTAAQVGLDWGGGVYLNYLFVAVWLADVLGWWRGLAAYEARPRAVEWAVQGFLFFMAFNATVVFENGPTRWVAVAVCAALAWACFHRANILSTSGFGDKADGQP